MEVLFRSKFSDAFYRIPNNFGTIISDILLKHNLSKCAPIKHESN